VTRGRITLALVILLLVVTPLSIVAYTVLTESGLQLAVRHIPKRIGRSIIDISEPRGTLAGGFEVDHVEVTHERAHVIVEGVKGRISALALLWQTIEAHDVTVRRSFVQVERYSAELSDFVTRAIGSGSEELVFIGWLTPLLAVAGLVAIRHRRGLALVLALAAVVPCLFALGANLPGYETVWRVVPGLDSTRVPERFMPIACLALAALAAFGLDAALTTLVLNQHKRSAAAVALVTVVVLALDLRVPVFGAVVADTPNRAYAAMQGDGRLLELPVFRPDIHYGSVYLGYARQSPRERPQGYSTIAPPAADRLARRLRGLSCGRGEIPADLGIRFVAVHRGLYEQSGFFGPACAGQAEAMLRERGWHLLARDGAIATYAR